MFSQELINTVHWVNKVFDGKVTFCGSFGLILNGLLDREIKDLDVITEDNYYGQPNQLVDPEIRAEFLGKADEHGRHDWGNSGRYTVNGNTVWCFKIEHADHKVTVDVLYTGIPTEFTEVDFHGVKIKVETPQGAIAAKEQYIKSPQLQYREKHERDLNQIKRNENNRPHASRGLSEAGPRSTEHLSSSDSRTDDIPF